jgi:two-component system, NarL family, response regulator YdfI
MITVLIFAVNAKLGRTLEQLPEQDSSISIVGIADDQRSFVRLADTFRPNVILTQGVPIKEQLGELRVGHEDAAWVLFVESKSERASLEALSAGASAILPLSANPVEIIATIKMVADGLAIFPQKLLTTLPSRAEIVDGQPGQTDSGRPRLSERERIVLTAMANGLSNKEIARRLGISFHTVKFHVASILEKLEVETRTEAVIKAAQLGLVML